MPIIPYLLVLGAGAIVGAGVVYKTSSSAKATLDKASELAERVEKPIVVLGALAGLYLLSRKF